MVFVDMDPMQFYQPPAKADLRNDGWPKTSNLRVPSPLWDGKTLMAFGASLELKGYCTCPTGPSKNSETPCKQPTTFKKKSHSKLPLKKHVLRQRCGSFRWGSRSTSTINMLKVPCSKICRRRKNNFKNSFLSFMNSILESKRQRQLVSLNDCPTDSKKKGGPFEHGFYAIVLKIVTLLHEE